MNFLFRVLLTINALSLFASMYYVRIWVGIVILGEQPISVLNATIFLAVCIAVPMVLVYISIMLSKKLEVASLGDVRTVWSSSLVYFGFFVFFHLFFAFITLVLTVYLSGLTWFILSVCALFIHHTSLNLFNPLLFLFGYRFYVVVLKNKSRVILITKQKIKDQNDIDKNKKYRKISDSAFIDMET